MRLKIIELIWSAILVIACISILIWQIIIKSPIFVIGMFAFMAIMALIILVHIIKEIKEEKHGKQ
jgi:hypothetical protein